VPPFCSEVIERVTEEVDGITYLVEASIWLRDGGAMNWAAGVGQWTEEEGPDLPGGWKA